jgi:hypothetical protein
MNQWDEFRCSPTFPGRSRIYGAWAGATDHPDACDAEALALAVGAAAALAPGPGDEPSLTLTAVINPDPQWWEVAALAGRLAPPGLVVAVDADVDLGRLAALGWLTSPQPCLAERPLAVPAQPWVRRQLASSRRVWTPVDLPTLGRACLPPWPLADNPAAQADLALAWLGEREPALVLTTGNDPWLLAVAAERACHGQRSVWRVPPGTRLDPSLLARIARLQMPLKVLLDPADAVALPPGWWTAAARTAAEASAMLAWILGDESPWSLVLPIDEELTASTWPTGQAWVPGQGLGSA